MAAISDFYRYCDLMADTSDTFLGPLPFLQRSLLYKCTGYCENDTGSEGVNH